MTELRTFDEITAADVDAVGGKGLSLGLMASAGLPVPPGFCVTSAAFRRWRGQSLTDGHELGRQHRRRLPQSSAAGRSPSAPPPRPRTAPSPASPASRKPSSASRATMRSATPSAAAGPRSTPNAPSPTASTRASATTGWPWPSSCSGSSRPRSPASCSRAIRSTPRAGGCSSRRRGASARASCPAASRRIASTSTATPGPSSNATSTQKPHKRPPKGRQTVPAGDAESALPGRRASWRCWPSWAGASRQFYGDARDVEWAWADGRFWLLQARPITAAGADEREQVRREEIAALAAKADPGGTVWARFNLAESLPEPTPMTWAIMRRFMSGRGGYGLMYRDLGFKPDPSVDDDCSYDLVAGRPYCNLNRELRFYAGWLPYEHSFAAIKKDPQKAFYPHAAAERRPLGPVVLADAAVPAAVPRRRVGGVRPEAVADDARVRRPLPPRGAARLRRRGGQGGGGRPRRARRRRRCWNGWNTGRGGRWWTSRATASSRRCWPAIAMREVERQAASRGSGRARAGGGRRPDDRRAARP